MKSRFNALISFTIFFFHSTANTTFTRTIYFKTVTSASMCIWSKWAVVVGCIIVNPIDISNTTLHLIGHLYYSHDEWIANRLWNKYKKSLTKWCVQIEYEIKKPISGKRVDDDDDHDDEEEKEEDCFVHYVTGNRSLFSVSNDGTQWIEKRIIASHLDRNVWINL